VSEQLNEGKCIVTVNWWRRKEPDYGLTVSGLVNIELPITFLIISR
jgi:hypothetical protein